MTTPFIPGAVYVTRTYPTAWQTYVVTAAQAVLRGPRGATAGHAFLAVGAETIIDVQPGVQPDGDTPYPDVSDWDHPADTGDWWAAYVPPVDVRPHVVAAAWRHMRRPRREQARYTYAACVAAGRGRAPRGNERACSTFVAELLDDGFVDAPGTRMAPFFGRNGLLVPWYATLPADIARAANHDKDRPWPPTS